MDSVYVFDARVPPDPGDRYPKVLDRSEEIPPRYTYDEED
jgi:hypothetical protein